jgi:hypothetical protein
LLYLSFCSGLTVWTRPLGCFPFFEIFLQPCSSSGLTETPWQEGMFREVLLRPDIASFALKSHA